MLHGAHNMLVVNTITLKEVIFRLGVSLWLLTSLMWKGLCMITRVTVSPVADSLIQVVGITEEGASLEAASSAITFTSPQRRLWAMPGETFATGPQSF